MSDKNTNSPALLVVLSVLGVLGVTMTAGLLLMQNKEFPDDPLKDVLTFSKVEPASENFDPISWARTDVGYPPLQKIDDNQNIVVTHPVASQNTAVLPEKNAGIPRPHSLPAPRLSSDRENPVTRPSLASPTKEAPLISVVTTPIKKERTIPQKTKSTQRSIPTKVSSSRKVARKIAFSTAPRRQIRENAYWIQVFSSLNIRKAEARREELASKGFSGILQSSQIGQATWYRVQLGAFQREDEARHYIQNLQKMLGYEKSFLLQSPVTRWIPLGS